MNEPCTEKLMSTILKINFYNKTIKKIKEYQCTYESVKKSSNEDFVLHILQLKE